MARWDWYSATVHGAEHGEVAGCLAAGWELTDIAPGRGKHGYERGAQIRRGERVLAELWWGGQLGVHVVGTGEDAPTVADVLEQFNHQPTRVDACEDFVEEGLFDRFADYWLAFATQQRLAITQVGDWHRGEARTLYLGSKDSACRLVIYEKGYQTGGDPNHVRVEVRVRPKGEEARARVAKWVPGEAFGASRWLVDGLAGLGWDHLIKQAVGTVWRPPDTERARMALLGQYGATLQQWAADLGGWEALAAELRQALETPAPTTAHSSDVLAVA